MDSMVNRYTSDRRIRSDDAYTPAARAASGPTARSSCIRSACREAYRDVPIVIGGIEASLRRIAHFDYWSEKVRRSVLLDAKADLLLYGNAERADVEIAHRLAGREDHATSRPARHGIRSQGAARLPAGSRSTRASRCAGAAESADRSLCDGRQRRRPRPKERCWPRAEPAAEKAVASRWCASCAA
jgi:radical SAM superfamily enzyme YgiQ (UPF0313 family)